MALTWRGARGARSIVTTFGATEINGLTYIVREFMEFTLQSVIENGHMKDIPFATKAEMVESVMSGVCFLHECQPPVVPFLIAPGVMLDKNFKAKARRARGRSRLT